MSLQLIREALITQIRHPSTFAAVASVGLHAMIGVALPTVFAREGGYLFGEGSGIPQDVQMIELSQAELSRLPNLSPPISDLPLSPDDSTVTLPPSDLPDTPNRMAQADSDTEIETRPNLPPRPGEPNRALDPNAGYSYPITPLPPRPSSSRNRTVVRSQVQRTPQRSLPQTTRRRSALAEAMENLRTQPEPMVGFGIDEDTRFEPREYENPADLLPRNDEVARRALDGNEGRNVRISPEELARRERAVQVAQELERRRRNLRRNSRDATRPEAQENERNWIADVSDTRVDPRSYGITGTYPKDACLKRLSGTAVFGAIAQPGGGLSNINMIQSAGYGIFNQQARSQIRGLSFSVNQPTPYRISVSFNYNRSNCPASLSVPESQPQETEQESRPQPSPQETEQESRPQPSPSPSPSPSQPEPSPSPSPSQPKPSPSPSPSQPEPSPSPSPSQPKPSPSPSPSQPEPSPSPSLSPANSPSPQSEETDSNSDSTEE